MGGSGPKSVSGSSRMNSELDENDKDTVVLDWFRPSESKTLRPVWPSESKTHVRCGGIMWKVKSPRMEL
jgi:hypothetical protein